MFWSSWLNFTRKFSNIMINNKGFNPLSAYATKWSNKLQQFVGKSQQIFCVCLSILLGWDTISLCNRTWNRKTSGKVPLTLNRSLAINMKLVRTTRKWEILDVLDIFHIKNDNWNTFFSSVIYLTIFSRLLLAAMQIQTVRFSGIFYSVIFLKMEWSWWFLGDYFYESEHSVKNIQMRRFSSL